ncbi:MAG TPA: bifunctional transaldolase/phosoglucose isomerase [Candidatus Limnocylindrales bacterium]|nr:bifunctional transaldolase/phosoglucose isomerase [Candidatus Limnocylindrales bacterium]
MTATPQPSQLSAALFGQTASLPVDMASKVAATIGDWAGGDKVRRLWAGDATLWTGADEGQWLGWLTIVEQQIAQAQVFRSLASEIRAENFTHALLLGMGGSSLCPEVMKLTFGRVAGFPEMLVLDSTDPAQVATIAKKIDPARTLFIVSSKSGTTLEPNIFQQYFYGLAKQALGDKQAAQHFIAITDPGSHLEQVAKAQGFRHIFPGVPSIGGRYSALSNFGMIPAAAQGVDVTKFLERAAEMVRACGSAVPDAQNPGVQLGAILGTLAKLGRDKVTFISSAAISDLGAWLEQLLAESTGKLGKGLIPVDREFAAAPSEYGSDRLFVYLHFKPVPDATQDAAVAALERDGNPVVRIEIADIYDLGKEFFRWEIATAVAGSILGINAFNQPDVEASKIETRKLTTEYEKSGSLPGEKPFYQGEKDEAEARLFADERNAQELASAVGGKASLIQFLRAHLARLHADDYFGLLAYIEMNEAHQQQLQTLRHAVRHATRNATCLGFGPRFLHSTGQAYKGGPNSGVFLQITCDDAADVPIPAQKFTFGIVKAAQARGDFAVLAERGRRALRVHLGKDVAAGLATLVAAVREAVQ